jgi:hypothetical protein
MRLSGPQSLSGRFAGDDVACYGSEFKTDLPSFTLQADFDTVSAVTAHNAFTHKIKKTPNNGPK